MTSRPRTPLRLQLFTAAAVAALVVTGSALLPLEFAGQAATVIGNASACAWSLALTRSLPLGLSIPALLAIAVIRSPRQNDCPLSSSAESLKSLPLEPITHEPLATLARAENLPVYVTPSARAAAFCFGFRRPRVASPPRWSRA